MTASSTADSASGRPLWATLFSRAELESSSSCRTLTLLAEAAVQKGGPSHAERAVQLFGAALLDMSANEAAYVRATEELARLLKQEGWLREAVTLAWYRGLPLEQSADLERLPAFERAISMIVGLTDDSARLSSAARVLEQAGLLARAADLYEECGDARTAVALWRRLADRLDALGDRPYEAGLAHCKIALRLRALGEDRSGSEAETERRLIEAATAAESAGHADRAFDCHSVLRKLRQASSRSGDALDSARECLRIAMADHGDSFELGLRVLVVESAKRTGDTQLADGLLADLRARAEALGEPIPTEPENPALAEDLIEWEAQGSASQACAAVMLDLRLDLAIRRAALIARLIALSAEVTPIAQQERVLVALCARLRSLGDYRVLAPLERIAEHSSARVRQAAIEALANFWYKRTFYILERAVQDSDPGVVERAAKVLMLLNVPTGIDNVLRIYRSNPPPRIRSAALYALARADAPDTIRFLLEELDGENENHRQQVIGVAVAAAGEHFFEVARRVHTNGSPRLRRAIEDVFSNRRLQL